jgi:hypothetical protein
MTIEEWHNDVANAFGELVRQRLDFNGDSIAAYRGAINRLDKAVFQGFHMLHMKLNAARASQDGGSDKSRSVSAARKATVTYTIDDLE